jgi:hypothetical protein
MIYLRKFKYFYFWAHSFIISFSKNRSSANTMQPILAIEFDADHFVTKEACYRWLAKSDYEYLLEMRGFKLQHHKKGTYLSDEVRGVYAYSNNLWKYPNQCLVRPDPYVVIIKRHGTEVFSEVDLPAVLPKTLARIEEKKEKRAARLERDRRRRQEKKEEKKANENKRDPDPLQAKPVNPKKKRKMAPTIKTEELDTGLTNDNEWSNLPNGSLSPIPLPSPIVGESGGYSSV